MIRVLKVLLPCLLLAGAAPAQQEMVRFEDPQLKERYEDLLTELRCLVCQNQTLADSNADLAQDLREEVERLLREGKSDEAIINFMVDRYGDFVLYRPPLKTTTVILWFAPFVLAGLGAAALVWYLIGRNERKADAKIEKARRERAAALLAEEEEREADA
jgi:cytochrome c-type biogenesis protein CcmH